MDLVAEARRRFADKDIFWKNALAQNLENKQHGLSVHWATLCLGRLMDIRYPKRMAELLPDINAARRYLQQKPDDIDLGEKAREIWYRPNRDAPQTTLSKMYNAIHDYHAGANCVHSSCAVIGNLFCDDWPNGSDWHDQSEMMFAIVLNFHDDILNHNAKPEPNGT